jgi:hypothetical protein
MSTLPCRRSVMDRVAEHTTNKQKMDEFSMVYYNNLLVRIGGAR